MQTNYLILLNIDRRSSAVSIMSPRRAAVEQSDGLLERDGGQAHVPLGGHHALVPGQLLDRPGGRSLHGEVIGLGKLVDDLYELALSDLGALEHKRERLDLAELLDEVADGFRRRFEKKSLRLDNDAHGPMWMCGDPQRLRQLLANLLENSRRYTDSGGRLRITTERSAGHYRLRFEDTAPAVSDTDLPRLFERLYRVDKSRSRSLGGAGLGLSICYNIVTAHDGRIRAEHSPLGGLAIVVELPAEGDKPK